MTRLPGKIVTITTIKPKTNKQIVRFRPRALIMSPHLYFLNFFFGALVAVIAGVKMFSCNFYFFCRVALEFFSGLASLERFSLAIRLV